MASGLLAIGRTERRVLCDIAVVTSSFKKGRLWMWVAPSQGSSHQLPRPGSAREGG